MATGNGTVSRMGIAVAFVACLVCAASRAADLSPLMKSDAWRGHHRGAFTVEPKLNAMGDRPGIVFVGKPAKEKTTYASIQHRFDKPMNMSGLKTISFLAKANAKVKVKISLECEGGGLYTDFLPATLGNAFQKIEINPSALKAKGEPDLGAVKRVSFGFGLWMFDTREAGFTITLAGLTYHGTETAYVIPLPKRGVAIDGQYRDWGFEDTLYNWTLPDYIHLNGQGQVVPGRSTWRGATQLSGRFAFMMDDTRLYFLALVADATPFQGNDPSAPWNNDSVEVFLAFEPTEEALRFGGAKDAQIIFDCGKDVTRTKVNVRGEWRDATVRRSTTPSTWVVVGRQAKGYVLEAALGLRDLGLDRRERGARIGYSIKLNDFNGPSLIATPKNLKPHASCKAYRKAYVEIQLGGEEQAIEFGPLARNVLWPERFTRGEGRVLMWDMAKAHREVVSKTVTRTYLNGMWAAQAVDSSTQSPKADGWGYLPVPMGIGWYVPAYRIAKGSRDELGPEMNATALLPRDKSFFWFERTFVPEPEHRTGRLLLKFEYVIKEATVCLNGKLLGSVDRAATALDITDDVRHGQENRVDALVYTTIRPGNTARNGSCGITGDVYLEHHRHAPVIDDVWVKRASGSDGSFEVVVETKGTAEGLRLALDVLDGDRMVGRVEEGVAQSPTTLSGRCAGFRPWSPERPDLFRLRVRATKAGVLLDERYKRFGFRTFDIKDARFMLNGKLLRLRVAKVTNPSGTWEPSRLRELKRYGHNSVFVHAGQHGYNTPLFEKLDENGFVAFAATGRDWPDAHTVAEIRRYRSHPSVLGYVSDQFGQLDLNGFSHNPFSTSDTYYPESAAGLKLYAFLRKRYGLFQSVDPTRPYFPHATGNFEGSLRSVNHYPTYDLNLLDHMMYFAPWSKRENPQLPYHLYECGVYALSPDISQPVHTFEVEQDRRRVKRLITYECASRYLGTRAFDNWREWEAQTMKASVRGFRICGIDGFTPWVENDVFLHALNSRNGLDIQDDRQLSYRYFMLPYRDVMEDNWMRCCSWYYKLRAQARWPWPEKYGLGSVERKPSEFTAIYENEMQPFFACVGGPARDVFAREHNYFAGERIEKQIVAVNDTESDVDVTFHVVFAVGPDARKQTVSVRLRQGEIVKQPVVFTAPAVQAKTRGALRLSYASPSGGQKGDVFSLTIFPRHRPPQWKQLARGARIGTASRAGEDRLIAKVGIPSRSVSLNEGNLDGLDLLVIERNALGKSIRRDALKGFIDAGGTALILEQTNRGLLDWRLRERRLEAVFIADRQHPVVNGLDDDDLAYFRGPAKIVPREKQPSEFYRHGQSTALDTPHLTNEGLAASYVFQKPCYGSFRPILVGGYDLEETALIEVRSGKGRALFCQVDVTDRYGRDPAATLLVDNLLRYLLETKPTARAPAVEYAGGRRGRAFLDRLGIAHAGGNGGRADLSVLVIGDGAEPSPAVFGNRAAVVVLPFAKYLPDGVRTRGMQVQKIDYPRYWNRSTYQFTMFKSPRPAPDRLGLNVGSAFRGLVDNDAYFFESPKLKAYSPSVGFSTTWRSQHGTMVEGRMANTRVILCSVDPGALKHGECRRKAWRIWSVIFANLGVANCFEVNFDPPLLDISQGQWTFLTDPDGRGVKDGYPAAQFAGRKPRPILTGKIWEEQGVTDANPNIEVGPDSSYDGFSWYFRTAMIPAALRGKPLYLHVDGVRDIKTYNRTSHQTDLWINGKKQPPPVGVWNAREGGRAGRLWKVDVSAIKFGTDNLISIRVFNDAGAGGIHRRPVRFETEGQNEGMLLPYEFVRTKYNPYFFWAW